MTETSSREPWDQMADLLAQQDAAGARGLLAALPGLEIARTLSRLSEDDQKTLLTLLEPGESANLLSDLSDAQTVEIIEELTPAHAASIIQELPSAERADILGDLTSDEATAILGEMRERKAHATRQLLLHDPETAGGLMITEYVAYREHVTVGDVVDDLRANGDRYSDFEIQYAYITDVAGLLVGVLRLRDLLLSRPTQSIRTIMLSTPLHVRADTSLDELRQFFVEHVFVGVPVTDDEGRLLGVVRRSAVEAALGARATEAFLSVSGLIGEDELRTMPLLQRSRRRLAWLSINIVLNVIAASVIAFYQDTLAAVIALAVFLPMISDMSGCSGNQAVAVSIRELALGLVKPYEFLRVIAKEGSVGIINGLILGLLVGALAVAWKGNIYLGMVVGTALMLNTVIAVLLGGVIPLALKALKQDPALASGPILTTVTDMMGFLMVLSFASVLLSKLV